jgi:acetyltransferase-like isoleucine patch superfamily enzyme
VNTRSTESDDDFNAVTGLWDYGTLPANVRIGAGCFLERRGSFELFRSTRDSGLVLGERVRAYTWTTFNVEPSGRIEVGDDTVLVGAVFMCADEIRIGRRVIVSYNVTIADSDFHPIDPEQRMHDAVANTPHGNRTERPALVTRPVRIDDDVHVGIGAIILKGVHVGAGARIGAGAVVTRDVPPRAIVAGNPARIIADEAAK